MTDDRTLERAARSWLEEGPTRAPDRAVEAALNHIQTTSQERDLRIPWRLPIMNPITRLAAVAIVIAIAVGGAYYALRTASVGHAGPSVEGTWAVTFSRPEMLSAGIVEGEDNPDNYGQFTLSFHAGQWQLNQYGGAVDGPPPGTYTVDQSAITLVNSDNEVFVIPFTVTDTTLTFGPGGPVTFRVKPWTRVGP